jgi:hypothetical protein
VSDNTMSADELIALIREAVGGDGDARVRLVNTLGHTFVVRKTDRGPFGVVNIRVGPPLPTDRLTKDDLVQQLTTPAPKDTVDELDLAVGVVIDALNAAGVRVRYASGVWSRELQHDRLVKLGLDVDLAGNELIVKVGGPQRLYELVLVGKNPQTGKRRKDVPLAGVDEAAKFASVVKSIIDGVDLADEAAKEGQ